MKMKAQFNEADRYISVETSGIIDLDAVSRVLKEMPTLIQRYGSKRILHDLRKADIQLDTSDIYFTPQKIQEAGYHDTKRAFLFSAENEQDFTFFETVSANRGQQVQVFTDESQALEWLLK